MTATPKDLQDEVGRLRAVLKTLADMDIDLVRLNQNYDAILQTIKRVATDVLAQSPPESADECKHPRIYTAQDGHKFCDECEAYLGEESPPQACVICGKPVHTGLAHYCSEECEELAVAGPITSPQEPQACEHKGGRDTYQGKPFCKRCGKTVEPNAPQEPKEGERDG